MISARQYHHPRGDDRYATSARPTTWEPRDGGGVWQAGLHPGGAAGIAPGTAGDRAGRWGSFEAAGFPRGVCCPEASMRQFNSDVCEIHIAVVQDAHEEQLGVGFRPVKRSANSFKR
jgi:hypothetical protein